MEERGLYMGRDLLAKVLNPTSPNSSGIIHGMYIPFRDIDELNEWYVGTVVGCVRSSMTLRIQYGALNIEAQDRQDQLRNEIKKVVEPIGEVYRLVHMSMKGKEPDFIVTPEQVIERCNYFF
jgi:hypothetical protein